MLAKCKASADNELAMEAFDEPFCRRKSFCFGEELNKKNFDERRERKNVGNEGGARMIIVDKPRWKMGIVEDKKEVFTQIHGFIRDEMIAEYLEDLVGMIGKMQKSAYSIVVDATYQSPLPRIAAAGIGDTMMAYTKLGFKHVKIIGPKSKISFVQVRNGMARVNFPGEFVEPKGY